MKKRTSPRRSAVAAGCILVVACSNNDVPEHEPTFGTGGAGDTDDGGDAADAGVDETGTTGDEVESQCWPDREPADPALFQCFGVGAGVLEWEQYAGAWSAANQPVTIEFPSENPSKLNVQACCESSAMDDEVDVGCIQDCARAACNLAMDKLRGKLHAGPPAGCAGACAHRFEQTMNTWIAYLETNYDLCLMLGEDETTPPFNFPDPPAANDAFPWGAGRGAVLDIDCVMDEVEVPYDTEQTCETGLNEPSEAVWEDWVCPLVDGEVAVSGVDGGETASLRGNVAFRRGVCASGPCWIELGRLDLETLPSKRPGMLGDPLHASLAYPAFGPTAAAEGTLAVGMLGLHVMVGADTRVTGSAARAPITSTVFTMANSSPVRLEVVGNEIDIAEAWFAWDEHDVTIAIRGASCYCSSCS
jgi:hypothetical protein